MTLFISTTPPVIPAKAGIQRKKRTQRSEVLYCLTTKLGEGAAS